MKKVKTLKRFTDLVEDKVREVDDEFEVSKSRFNQLSKADGYIKEIVVKDEDKKKSGD